MSVPCSSLFSVLDLFSGIGGFALATKWAGGRTLAFAEVADYPSKVLAARWPEVPNLGDVRCICRRIADNLKQGEECACIGTDQFTDTYGFPDVVAGGVPCQPASLVGKRHGTSDERWLWPETLRIIGELQPRYAILENPRAILSLEGGQAFRGILGHFADLGYDVQWDVVSASALGAGHRRERLWILASHADSTRLEGHAGNGEAGGEAEEGRHVAQGDLRTREVASTVWYRQSGIEPVVDGLPGRVVRDQLTAVGNSLVPQVALVWLKAIASAMTENTTPHQIALDTPGEIE